MEPPVRAVLLDVVTTRPAPPLLFELRAMAASAKPAEVSNAQIVDNRNFFILRIGGSICGVENWLCEDFIRQCRAD